MEYRFAIMYVDAVGYPTYDWLYTANHQGCPNVEAVTTDAAAIVCAGNATDLEDIRSQIMNYYFVVGIPEETYDYRHHTWDWHDHPDPRLLHGTSEEVITDLNANFSASILTQLHEFVNDIRDDYQMPIIALEDDVPPVWESGVALEGGSLVSQGLRVYWVRYDIAAANNTVEPFNDEHHTRFLDFFQGPMEIPASTYTLARSYETSYNQMNVDKVYIDWQKKYMYFVPDEGFDRLDIVRFSLASASNDKVRLIMKVNHRDEWRTPFDSDVPGIRIRFDIQWQSGDWEDEETVLLRFSTV